MMHPRGQGRGCIPFNDSITPSPSSFRSMRCGAGIDPSSPNMVPRDRRAGEESRGLYEGKEQILHARRAVLLRVQGPLHLISGDHEASPKERGVRPRLLLAMQAREGDTGATARACVSARCLPGRPNKHRYSNEHWQGHQIVCRSLLEV